MTHHEDQHQGRRLLLVGGAVLVVLSGVAAAPAPQPQVNQREIGTVTLMCTTAPDLPLTRSDCRVVIQTPFR